MESHDSELAAAGGYGLTAPEADDLIRWTLTPGTRAVILAALEDAASRKRDQVSVCGDCHDGTCMTCQFRTETAAEYEQAAEELGRTYDAELDDEEPEPVRPCGEPEPSHGAREPDRCQDNRYTWPGDPGMDEREPDAGQ